MTPFSLRPRHQDKSSRTLVALVCAALLVPGEGVLLAQAPAAAAEPAPVKLPPDQLDSLVAPIALYPDDLLAQTLVAATYPLEIVQLQQWLDKNKNLKDKALADAVAKQPWDPSIQSMAAFPEVVKRLADDIQWTTQLGDAFLDQQGDVMDACQRMRKKAKDKGALTSNEQQKVETKVVEEKTIIVVQPTNPEVIYVPSYNPTVVYPPPVYPYPPVYYPPPPPYGAAFVSFTAGVMIGAAVWGGSCCGCGWGHNDVNINVNNNFNRNTNVNRGGGGGNNWQHNSAHRGGAPYSSAATANKYGGSAKGGQGSRGASPSAGTMSRGGGAGASPGASSRGAGGAGASPSAGSRGGGASPSASTASRGGGASPSASTASRGGGGSSGAFGGGSGGYSGSSAKASSSRGSSSMGSRGGGGGGRSGGGRR
jgi:hypothetical protein